LTTPPKPRARVDLHCHILPGLDDGATNLAQALAMARLAVADGIEVICATPHHGNGVYRNEARVVRQAVAALQAAIDEAGIAVQVLPGAEHHLVPELPDELVQGQAITLADQGRFALVELPVHDIPLGAETLLERIIAAGIVPIIVHPERNSTLRRDPERLGAWIDLGCLTQITAQSCTGQFGEAVWRASQQMVQSGWIHLLASDAHRDRRRIPALSAGVQQLATWTNAEAAALMADAFPQAILAGQHPDISALQAAVPPRKGLFTRWR